MSIPTSFVKVSDVGPRVKRLTLDRPPVNAANTQLLDDLHDALVMTAEADLDVLIITGEGRTFCSGNDIHEFAAMDLESAEVLMAKVRRAFWRLAEFPVPVIAQVNGAAFGTGMALAALSDIVVASDRATFGLPELDVGVLGGLKFTRRFVPELAVRRLFLTSERVSAAEFKALGASISVVAHDDLATVTDELSATLVSKGGVALRFAKQAMNAVEHLDTRTGYEYEQTFTVRMAARPESKAAVKSVIDSIAAKKRSGDA